MDCEVLSSSELNLFVQIATSGDSTVAAAIGKRYLLGIEGFKQDFQKEPRLIELVSQACKARRSSISSSLPTSSIQEP